MTIEQIIRWFTDTDAWTFSRDIYGKEWDGFHWENEKQTNGYLAEKFQKMQRDPIGWMASLDPQNRAKLEKLIEETK